jgi:hypothetical protein
MGFPRKKTVGAIELLNAHQGRRYTNFSLACSLATSATPEGTTLASISSLSTEMLLLKYEY